MNTLAGWCRTTAACCHGFALALLAAVLIASCGASEDGAQCEIESTLPCPEACSAFAGRRVLEDGCYVREPMDCIPRTGAVRASTACAVRVRDGALFWIVEDHGLHERAPDRWRECNADEAARASQVGVIAADRSCP